MRTVTIKIEILNDAELKEVVEFLDNGNFIYELDDSADYE